MLDRDHSRLAGGEMRSDPRAGCVALPGCEKPLFARDMCRPHYRALRTHGDALYVSLRSKPGQGFIDKKGYRRFRKGCSDCKAAHHLVAERALGRELRGSEQVHHVDENKQDNRNENLVICPDNAYHAILHQRTRALAACGNANWRKCHICKGYDDPKNMYVRRDTGSATHRACKTALNAKRRSAQ